MKVGEVVKEIKEQKIINGYKINITKVYLYNPLSVQQGYELIYNFAVNNYLKTRN